MTHELVHLPPNYTTHLGKETEASLQNYGTEGIESAGPMFDGKIIELDEAVIHFRCGDLRDSTHPNYGFMTFHGYAKHIPSYVRTIGIITQPFDDPTDDAYEKGANNNTNTNTTNNIAQNRREDAAPQYGERCRIVVLSFVEYLEQQYPHASIRIRNGIGETIVLAFARIILANVTIAAHSTFGFLASIATYGTAYVRMPNPSIRFDHLMDNMVLFDEPDFIPVSKMKELWETQGATGALQWFWNGTQQSERENMTTVGD